MTEQDLTDTWLRLKALEQAITAFSKSPRLSRLTTATPRSWW